MKTGGLLEEQEEGFFLNNISNSQLPRDRKGVSGKRQNKERMNGRMKERKG